MSVAPEATRDIASAAAIEPPLATAAMKGSGTTFDSTGEDQFRLAMESSPAATIVVGADGLIHLVNAETEHMFGYSPKELVGQSIDILLPTRLRQVHATFRQSYVANPSKRPMGVGRDLKAARRDGTEFPVEIGLTPIRTEAGVIVLATVLDITARKQAENALAQRAVELERANERLTQFAHIASLDLQGPLRRIEALAQLLGDAIACPDQANTADASRAMRASAVAARKIVDDLLAYFSAIHRCEQRLQDLDLREEIESALAGLSKSIGETNTEITIEIPSVRFRADRPEFARLMQNIVSNAIKYRKPDQPAKVEITAVRVDDSTIRLAISDNGVGFEEEFAQAIFEPFQHLDSKVQYPGSGIELATYKAIADCHGWEISVRSRPGEGTTFFFTIPTAERPVAA